MRNGAEQLTPRLSTTIRHGNNQSVPRNIEPNNKELPKPENLNITAIDPSSNITREHYASAQGIPATSRAALKNTTYELPNLKYSKYTSINHPTPLNR